MSDGALIRLERRGRNLNVRRSRSALFAVFTLISFLGARASADPILQLGRFATTQYQTDQSSAMLWATTAAGHVIYRRDLIGGRWTDAGWFQSPSAYDGLSAVSWPMSFNGTPMYQTSTVTVRQDGGINELMYWFLASNGSDYGGDWCGISVPGISFEGPLQIVRDNSTHDGSGVYHLHVAAISTTGDLYVLDRPTGGGCADWTWFNAGNPGEPIAWASVTGAALDQGAGIQVPQFFFVTQSGKVGRLAQDVGYNWTNWKIAQPGVGGLGNVTFGFALSASAWWDGYRRTFRVFGRASDQTIWALATDYYDNWTWYPQGAPQGTTFQNAWYAVPSVSYPAGSSEDAIDSYGLGADGNLYRMNFQPGVGWSRWLSLGKAADVSQLSGGMEAYATGTATTRSAHAVLFGAIGSTGTLLGRDPTGYWFSHGYPAIERQSADVGVVHSESIIAESGGAMAVASIVRTDPWYSTLNWSTSDGESWNPSVTIPPVDGNGWPNPGDLTYVSDPVVAFDAGTTNAVVVALQWSLSQCTNAHATDGSKVFFRTTSNGSFTGPATTLEAFHASATGVDHPWVAIDPTSGRRHFVWTDPTAGGGANEVYYAFQDPPFQTLSGPFDLLPGSAPRIVVDAGGTPYLIFIADATSGADVCTPTCVNGQCWCTPYNLNAAVGMASFPEPIYFSNATGSGSIRNEVPWAFAASPTIPGQLYYVFSAAETSTCAGNQPPKQDVFMSVSANGGAAWSTPTVVNSNANDCADQFDPEVSIVSRRTTNPVLDETPIVHYYSFQQEPSHVNNQYFVPAYSVGANVGIAYVFSGEIYEEVTGTASDPALLPKHCWDGTNPWFLGDYHQSPNGFTHTHSVYSEAPIGSPKLTALLKNSSLTGGCW